MEYFKDHYLCLWEVTGGEVIGHWEWTDLVANERWYHEIILPAFRKHTIPRTLAEDTLDLSALMNQLSSMFPGNIMYYIASLTE
jgi:hypothetical protein